MVTIPNVWFVSPDTANEEGENKDVKDEGYELQYKADLEDLIEHMYDFSVC